MQVNISYMLSWCLTISGEFLRQLRIVGGVIWESFWVYSDTTTIFEHNYNHFMICNFVTMYNSWAKQVSILSFPSFGWAVENMVDGPQAFSMPVAVFSYGPNDPRFLAVWTGRTRTRSTGKGVILLRHLKQRIWTNYTRIWYDVCVCV